MLNDACSPDKKRAPFTDTSGLYLEVSPAGAKRWFWKIYTNGKEGRLSLGSYPVVSLTAERKARDVARMQKGSGIERGDQGNLDSTAANTVSSGLV